MRIRPTFIVAAFLLFSSTAFSQTTVEDLLKDYTPRQPLADIETPKANQFKQCTQKVVNAGGGSGYVVFGPQGQVLRRFTDSDGDEKVDQFRYYKHGVEVYRDIDSDGDEKIDQFRWLNAGGTRWGIDKSGNGRIDEWKRISAQEAAQVAVTAMIAGDSRMLQTVLLNPGDIRSLGLKGDYAQNAEASVANPSAKMKQAIGATKIFTGSKWMRFDAQAPGLIPSGKVASRDLMVYENAMAMVESAGKPALIHVGELVKVGETWKLVNIPKAAEGNRVMAMSVLMSPELANTGPAGAGGAGAMTKEMRDLVDRLRKLDGNAPAPTAGRAAISRYNRERASILANLATVASTQKQRDEFTKQFADGVAAAVQARDGWPEGLSLLVKLEKQVAADPKRSKTDVYSYLFYRRMLAEYALKLQKAEGVNERQEVQEGWLEQLPTFVKKFPNAPDAADALIEIGKNEEFSGKLDEAERSYKEVARRFASEEAGKLGKGALKRLGLEGKSLRLSGTDLRRRPISISQAPYKGKVVLVLFWSTWCEPCKQEVPLLNALYAKYRTRGFEILGVNLGDTPADITTCLLYTSPSPRDRTRSRMPSSA